MLKKNKKYDFFNTIILNFTNLLSGIFIFPIFLYYLNLNDVGQWYLYLTFYTILALGDFGLTAYLSRNITYNIAENFLGEIKDNINDRPIKKLLNNSFSLYLIFSFIIILISLLIILPYINHVILKENFLFHYNRSWFIYVFSIILVNLSNFYNAILKGFNCIDKIQSTLTIVKIVSLFFTFIFLKFGFGLEAMVLGFLISSIIQLILLKYHSDKVYLFRIDNKLIDSKSIKFILSQSISLFYMSLGTVLIFQSISLLIATFLGVKILATYSFTVQIVSFLTVFTTMFLNLHIPELTFLYATKNKYKIKEILDKAHAINFILYILGILFILFFSDYFFKLIGKNNLLLQGYEFGIIIILYFFESNMTLSTTFLIATNKIPFLKSSLISGLLITAISFLFLKFTKASLVSILFVQLFIQIVYNYWKWTYMIIKEYSINIFDLVKFRNT